MTHRITFDVLYDAGHTCSETREKTDYFCPHCGVASVWDEVSDGDYYLGTTLTCANCRGTFHHPQLSEGENRPLHQRVLKFRQAIKGGVSEGGE